MRFHEAAVKPRIPLDAMLGFGHEAGVLRDRIDGWCRDLDVTASTKTKTLETEFYEQVSRWNESCAFSSSPTRMILDPAYQRIIGLGTPVIPLILRELVHRPDHWDWALRALTGVAVTDPADEGNVRRIAAKWIAWGKEHGYLQ